MTKARKLGWNGYVDSTESYLEVIHDFTKLKMIPPVPRAGRLGLQWGWWADENSYEGYSTDLGMVKGT